MADLLTRETLELIRKKKGGKDESWIRVGMSTCGVAAGAKEVYDALVETARRMGLEIEIRKCGCLGMCQSEPLVEVKAAGLPPILYGGVTPDMVHRILEKHVLNGLLVNDHVIIRKFGA